MNTCSICGYPYDGLTCANPGCTANPSVPADIKKRWATERQQREAEEAERAMIRRVREAL